MFCISCAFQRDTYFQRTICFDTTVTQKHSKTVRLFQFNPSGSDEANALSCLIHFNFMYVLVDQRLKIDVRQCLTTAQLLYSAITPSNQYVKCTIDRNHRDRHYTVHTWSCHRTAAEVLTILSPAIVHCTQYREPVEIVV